MTTSIDPTLNALNDCGCCAGVSIETPVEVENRPGASAIVYRVGTHSKFKETLLARLSGSNSPPLRDFSVRYDDDFTIALLDAWSTMADVLTFYQERIANESFLRTATERTSVLELARLIDYQLRPGVAASTYLAFTLEDAPGALGQPIAGDSTVEPEPLPPISIPVGAKTQSIPGPGEQAQTFETVEEIQARVEWNAIRPRLLQQQITKKFINNNVILQGTTTGLKKGDTLLIVHQGSDPIFKRAADVIIDDRAKTTRVNFDSSPSSKFPPYVRPELEQGNINSSALGALNEDAIEKLISHSWTEEDLEALIELRHWQQGAVVSGIKKALEAKAKKTPVEVHVFRQRAPLFGYNAPKQVTYSDKGVPSFSEWSLDGETSDKLYLDSAYDAIDPDGYITIEKPGKTPTPFRIKEVAIQPRTAYGISSKTTLISLADAKIWWNLLPASPKLGAFRDVLVHAQSEELLLAQLPIDTLVSGDTLTLNSLYLGLRIGQRLLLTGERSDLPGVAATEAVILSEVIVEGGFTVVRFESSLAHSYVRKTVVINANVALATHGETVQEVMGGGDGSRAYQKFVLRQPPVSHVSAATPSGSESTLEVRVNDVLWHEVPDLFGHAPDDRVFVTRLDDEAKTTVTFGDGITGARLPTGQENVRAKYRKGIGRAGLVRANQLTQLMTRPLGVKGVNNPLPADGAADREELSEARSNAPLTVLTLGRIVSLQDYQDFARAFSGIAKALATWTWFGESRGVFVTVAGADGSTIAPESNLYRNLLQGMIAAGDPSVPLLVQSYQPRFFRLSIALKIDPDYLPEKTFAAVEAKLRASFSFTSRNFGQAVQLSEVISAVQNVSGVVAVVVKQFYRADQQPANNPPQRLEAAAPRPGSEIVSPAEILILDPRPLSLEELK